jgi:membrane fusion protein
MSDSPRAAPLFRPEAVAHRMGTAFGSMLIPHSRLLTVFVVGAVAASFAICTLIVSAEYTRRISALGWLNYSPAQSVVVARQDGMILDVQGHTGQRVKKGDRLVTMTMSRSSSETRDIAAVVLEKLRAERDSLVEQVISEKELDRQERDSLGSSVLRARKNIARLDESISVASQRLDLAKRNRDRAVEAAMKQALSQKAVDDSDDAYLAAKLGLVALHNTLSAERGQLASLTSDLGSRPIKLEQRIAQLQRQMITLDQRIAGAEALRDELFEAPMDGVITSVDVEPGEFVNAGKPLVSIRPPGAELRAELLVPTRASGFIEPGMVVSLRYDAFPYEKFGNFTGIVSEVDRLVVTSKNGQFPISVDGPVHRVRVVLDSQVVVDDRRGRPISLQPGMTLRADVQQERKRIVEWIVDPLFRAMNP